jgi:hypothetical protein
VTRGLLSGNVKMQRAGDRLPGARTACFRNSIVSQELLRWNIGAARRLPGRKMPAPLCFWARPCETGLSLEVLYKNDVTI